MKNCSKLSKIIEHTFKIIQRNHPQQLTDDNYSKIFFIIVLLIRNKKFNLTQTASVNRLDEKLLKNVKYNRTFDIFSCIRNTKVRVSLNHPKKVNNDDFPIIVYIFIQFFRIKGYNIIYLQQKLSIDLFKKKYGAYILNLNIHIRGV